MEQEKKLFKDLKLDDTIYKLDSAGNNISEIKVTSVSNYEGTRVNINGNYVADRNNSNRIGSVPQIFTTKEEAEEFSIDNLKLKIDNEAKDLVIREENLKNKYKELEELKKKYNK